MPKPDVLTDFFDRMKAGGIDYDIIGLSYYPAFHGSLSTLETALTALERKQYGKDMMIVETGYSYAWALGGTEYDYTKTYPYSEEGQRQFTADLVAKLKSHPGVKGLFWWWPEDNGNKQVTNNWWNAALYDHNSGQPYAAFYELSAFAQGSTAITAPQAKPQCSQGWYSLQGTPLSGQPSHPGVYIRNGQAVIVR